MASHNSLWRGYDYFEAGKVKELKKIGPEIYESKVLGTMDYHVLIDLNHPRKSHRDCLYANGKRIICKHMVATYFMVFPDEGKKLYREWQTYEQEQEAIEFERYQEVKEYVNSF